MKKESFLFLNLIIGFLVCLFHTVNTYAQITENYSIPGSYAWTCPPNVTSVTVQCWGAGGGGGNSGGTTSFGGHGGGGGAFSQSTISVNPGQIYYIFVGAGGMSSPTDGQNTWFNFVNSSPISNTGILAIGGKKGPNNSGFTIVNRGESSLGFGTIKYSGGNGFAGYASGGQGGGSSAGFSADGTNAASINGATAPIGGGNGGNGSASANGQAGFNPGGGGGGGNDSSWNIGGDGGDGQVILIYTPSCSGIPSIPNVSVTPSSGCGTTMLYATNESNVLGTQYQWQSSTDNINWSNNYRMWSGN